ncbi:MAG: toll/interleukin-1 receptor domain-containing protein [Candidatus Accumulibacter sp.]|uniref:toll/interleukin-1 receptor domain-containing protein n=1 Tax=Accumulibacter sp. TaxID=2053492 RepID=UPI001D75D121|nr:toll/interleukin-1 receptor domain-containing protein [Accumulibacter sp.]MCB1940908.1 toll/interleukin-1 receptor domain-containing protein [Accumulibacter sp.]MCP5247765.1 toll/interleukin-1 receptor domain-containing protein [Accumulibacter sp.]
MERIRSIKVFDGSTERVISLVHGDLTELVADDAVDLLVASAFPDNYDPTSRSLIGALHERGVSVAELARDKAVDLRQTSGFWLSHEIAHRFEWRGTRRLAVFEPHHLGSPPEAVGALFRGLFPFLSDREDQRVAMPILSSGDQGWSPLLMMASLLDASIQWLRRGLPISELMIFERDPDRIALLRPLLDEAGRDADGAGTAGPSLSVPPPLSRQYDVFLSFSSDNADAADAFKREFAAIDQSATVFDFRLSIQKGKSYQDEIDRAIESCRKVVSILSPAYFASPECQEELNIARLRNKRAGFGLLIPLYWKSVSPALPLWLQTLNQCLCVEERVDRLRDAARDVHAGFQGGRATHRRPA